MIQEAQRLLSGDRSAILDCFDLYKTCIGPATSRSRFRSPHLTKDILSVAKATLWQKLEELCGAKFDGDDLTPYLATSVRFAVRRYLAKDHVVYVPYGTYRKMKEGFRFVPLSELASTDEHSLGDYLELFEDERDRAIVTGLWEGEKKSHIAEKLGVSPALVSERIKSIRRRIRIEGVSR